MRKGACQWCVSLGMMDGRGCVSLLEEVYLWDGGGESV